MFDWHRRGHDTDALAGFVESVCIPVRDCDPPVFKRLAEECFGAIKVSNGIIVNIISNNGFIVAVREEKHRIVCVYLWNRHHQVNPANTRRLTIRLHQFTQ